VSVYMPFMGHYISEPTNDKAAGLRQEYPTKCGTKRMRRSEGLSVTDEVWDHVLD